MPNLIITLISSICIIALLTIAFIVIKKKVTRLGKTVLWFFLSVYAVNWILYFCAIISKESELLLFIQIVYTFAITFKSFAFDFNMNVISNLINSNFVYAIAISIGFFMASLNTIYIFALAFIYGFKDIIKANKIRKRAHYIILIDNIAQIESINLLDMPSIIILDNALELKNNSRKYNEKKYCFLYNDDKEKALKKAGIDTKGTIVLSLSTSEEVNLFYISLLNECLPNYNKAIINYDSYDITKYVDKSKNFVFYSMDDLIARDFISRYPLYEQIDESMINYNAGKIDDTNIKHFFLGYSYTSEHIIDNIILNYQMMDDNIQLFICDKNAVDIIDRYHGKHYTNKQVEDLILKGYSENEYFDLYSSKFTLKPISYDKGSYLLKKAIYDNSDGYCLFYIDYGTDKINFESAIELNEYLKNSNLSKYKIYTRITKVDLFNKKELESKNISIYGDSASLLTKKILIDQSLDDLAIKVNGYYKNLYGGNEWDELVIIDKNSNRYAASSIIVKLNLIGLTLIKSNEVASISYEEYMELYNKSNKLDRNLNIDNYKYDNPRINIGIIEHYRWSSFQLFSNVRPMKKSEIFNDGKFKRRDKDLKLHSNLLSLKGVLDLEKYIFNCKDLSEQERMKESKILIKDFDLMDNLFDIIKDSDYKIVKLKCKK